jgi:hypothetical protein
MLVTSALAGLATEAVKRILDEHGKTYASNTLAGIVSAVVSTGVGGAYVALNHIAFTPEVGAYWAGLVFMTWLCSMVGYDKVIQTIAQFKKIEEDDE